VRDTIAAATRLLWIVGPLLVALVAVLAWILAGRALRPVRLLTAQVASIESRSLHERVPEPPSNDEIAELARTMNEMLGRLDAANESSRRLVSDASHELRTPIAVMRTELEVARRDPSNDWDDTSDVVVGELDRLALLVDDLLLLARGQERALSHQHVELVDLAHDVAARRRRADINIEVVVAGVAADAVVDGDGVAIERALDHLVANAARSARSRVNVTVERATIHVDDDGPGIPSEIGDSPLGGARVTLRLGAAPPDISPENAPLSSATMGP
jgi:signal transduction histidine kinase